MERLEPAPIRVRSAMDCAAELTRVRLEAGMTGEALDAHSGLPDRYTAKLENPNKAWGKIGLHSAMHELWLDALGMCLVLMRVDQAEALGVREPIKRPAFPGRG